MFERFCRAERPRRARGRPRSSPPARSATRATATRSSTRARAATGYDDRGAVGARRGALRLRRRDQHLDADRRGGARHRRRQHAAGPGREPGRSRPSLVPARRGPHDRGVPAGRRPGPQEGSRAAARTRATSLADLAWLPGRGGRLVATGGAVRNLAAAAQRAAFGSSGGIDIGVQGFVITADALAELVETLASLPAAERRTVPGIKPGRGDIILGGRGGAPDRPRARRLRPGSRRPRPVCETGCSSRARCSIRGASRCSPTSARRPCATSRSSTSPTCPTPSTSPGSRCRCTSRWSTAGLFKPVAARPSCCGPRRCSTTSG